jgi:hypothetical protein
MLRIHDMEHTTFCGTGIGRSVGRDIGGPPPAGEAAKLPRPSATAATMVATPLLASTASRIPPLAELSQSRKT